MPGAVDQEPALAEAVLLQAVAYARYSLPHLPPPRWPPTHDSAATTNASSSAPALSPDEVVSTALRLAAAASGCHSRPASSAGLLCSSAITSAVLGLSCAGDGAAAAGQAQRGSAGGAAEPPPQRQLLATVLQHGSVIAIGLFGGCLEGGAGGDPIIRLSEGVRECEGVGAVCGVRECEGVSAVRECEGV